MTALGGQGTVESFEADAARDGGVEVIEAAEDAIQPRVVSGFVHDGMVLIQLYSIRFELRLKTSSRNYVFFSLHAPISPIGVYVHRGRHFTAKRKTMQGQAKQLDQDSRQR